MTADGSTHRPARALASGSSVSKGTASGGLPTGKSSERYALPVADVPVPASPDDKTVISKPASSAAPVIPPAGSRALAALGESLTGQRLEHYELTQFVGGGGMGAVFRANDTRLGREVAVKVLSREQTDDETIRRFRNEAQSAARLDHPHIARVYYVGEDRGWNFIVFEFIEGTNLRQVVEDRGPLPLDDALHYTLQVAEALAHSSSRDVVHRDIKPSNVLVAAGGMVKLVDMGLARLHQVESSSDDLTASGVTLGTFDYISPEQARDPRSADVRSDIYSLGCTLYYMLAARPPFPDGTALQKLLRHNADEPPDVRIFRPDLPPRVTALLAKMLAKRPTQRQQTADELAADILALGQQLGLPKVAQHGQVVIPAPSAGELVRARAWQVAAAAAVLAVAVLLTDMYLPATPITATAPSAPHFNKPRLTAADLAPPPGTVSSPPIPPETLAPGAVPEAPVAISSSQNSVPSTVPTPAVANAGSPNSTALAATLAAPVVEGGIGGEFIEAEVSTSVEALPSATPPAAVPIQPNRIALVAAPPVTPEPEVEYVTSLAEACRRAAALNLSEIELAFSGRLLERPFDLPNQRLSLLARPGSRPVIVFQPTATERQMIRLSGASTARLKAQGIEFRLELPQEVASGWSLIALNTGQTLELFDCVLTVQDESGSQDQTAMIAVQRRRGPDMMSMADPQMAMAQEATIALENCLARGEATLVGMPDETPLSLTWKQGLLATSRRMIETGGCDSLARRVWETINIDLSYVTVSCPQGLMQVQRRPGRTNQFKVNVKTEHCILATNPSVPLFEFVGVRELAEDDLEASGERNCFPRPDVIFLRTISDQPGEPPRDIELGSGPSNENRGRWSIPWLTAPRADLRPHAATKADFAVEPTLVGVAGFDPALLPDAAPESLPQP